VTRFLSFSKDPNPTIEDRRLSVRGAEPNNGTPPLASDLIHSSVEFAGNFYCFLPARLGAAPGHEAQQGR
jgi:hypothetical protein